MPQRITESLVRKHAEHNNMEIATLEELSLHQLDIEKIEHLDKWCRELKILYLQGNLISRIENVGRLKKLEYLNLALNNIITIEKLEGCESLQKLDLTVNFVGDLLSVERLRENCHLRELFLTGNPCTKYEGYREYVVVAVPQLRSLDGTDITRTERLQASQKFKMLRERVAEQQEEYFQKREEEKAEREAKKRAKAERKRAEKAPGFDGRWYTDMEAHVRRDASESQEGGEECSHIQEGTTTSKSENGNGSLSGNEDSDDSLDDELEGYTPESRLATHRYMEKKRQETGKKPDIPEPKAHKKPPTLFRDGRPVNINEGRYDFSLTEDEDLNQFVLDLACPRFMDSSLMEVDVQPLYIRVTLKGKYFQLALSEEVSPDTSTAKRSQTTGHLMVTMPKAKLLVTARRPLAEQKQKERAPDHEPPPQPAREKSRPSSSDELLEVPSSSSSSSSKMAALANIVSKKKEAVPVESTTLSSGEHTVDKLALHDPDFVDDPDVPPLI